MSKPRRISFMDGLVCAIRDGEKDVTRRLIRFPPGDGFLPDTQPDIIEASTFADGAGYLVTWTEPKGSVSTGIRPPYAPGDVLAVCEALVPLPSGRLTVTQRVRHVHYRADDTVALDDGAVKLWPWKVNVLPARYCPTWAVRYRRQILSVRPERLSEVTDAEAVREGVARIGWEPTRESFIAGFKAMHKLDTDSVWVWRIEFSKDEVSP